MELDGKVCVITGANTGIGRVTATEIAKRGARVLVATRSEEKTKAVLADIAAAGGKAEWVALELGDLASVRRAARRYSSSAASVTASAPPVRDATGSWHASQ